MDKQRIIIDTDIGDDVDDALAIAFAANSPELDILGITTVFRASDARARMTVELLKVLDRDDIPVYKGCCHSLCFENNTSKLPRQYDRMLSPETCIFDESKGAVEFIIDAVKKYNGDITLVPIGPLTNIAAAYIQDPKTMSKVKRIVWMGGAFYGHFLTWNAKLDPEAVKVVFESGMPVTAVSREACIKCEMSQDQIQTIKDHNHPLAQYLSRYIDYWDKVEGRTVQLCDPLTIYAAYSDEYIRATNERVCVETKGEFTRGLTYVNNYGGYRSPKNMGDENKPLIDVVYDVDNDKFINLFMKRILL